MRQFLRYYYVDRLFISGALLLLILEVSALLMGLDDTPSNRALHSQRAKMIGEVKKIENQVRRRAQSSLVWGESKLEDSVYEYDSILTLPSSTAQIQLQGETRLNLDENTLVMLEPNLDQRDATIRVRFTRGSLRSRNPDQKLAIQNDSFSLKAEKGAEFSLMTLEDGRVGVEVQSGSATLSSKSGSEEVMHGERLILRDDQIEDRKKVSSSLSWNSEIPTRLYVSEFPAEVALKWKGDAKKFRVLNSKHKLQEIAVTGANSQSIALAEGLSFVSLEKGEDESPTLAIQIRKAERNRYLSPLPRDRVRADSDITFAWEPQKSAFQYRLEISKTQNFSGQIKRVDAVTTQTTLRLSDEGSYFWRVVGIDSDRFEIPAQEVYNLFVTKDPLASPQLMAPTIQPERNRLPATRDGASIWWSLLVPKVHASTGLDASFSWTAVPGAEHYMIEISKTPGFENPVINQKTTSPNYTWHGAAKGTYYWRVAAGAGGRLGLFSPLAEAKLENVQTFAGEGVTVKPAATPPPVPTPLPTQPKKQTDEPPVELGVDTSNSETPSETPTPTPPPPPTPTPEVASDARPVKDNGISGRVAWVPQYRSVATTSSDSTEGSFGGFVPLGADVELNFLTKANNLWEWHVGYDQANWKPKEGYKQSSLSESRFQSDVYYRPKLGVWAFGIGAETISSLQREGPETTSLHSSTLLGPSLRYSLTIHKTRELDLQLRLRFGDSLLGAHAFGALKFFIYEGKAAMIFVGPWLSGAQFSGGGTSIRDIELGAELGVGW